MSIPRTEGMDYTVEERIAAGELEDWRDPSGTVTLPRLRSTLATMLADGRPLLIASIELEDDLVAMLDELAGAVDLHLSVNMPGDQRIYIISAVARPVAGL